MFSHDPDFSNRERIISTKFGSFLFENAHYKVHSKYALAGELQFPLLFLCEAN